MIKIDDFDKILSRDDLTRENIKLRELRRSGWEILRYSSDEIKGRTEDDFIFIIKEILICCLSDDIGNNLEWIFQIEDDKGYGFNLFGEK